jgi:hypothetical protein
MKTKLEIGAKVAYLYWFRGAEQGSCIETMWQGKKEGVVIANKDKQWLIEHEDKSRTWVDEGYIVDLDWKYSYED